MKKYLINIIQYLLAGLLILPVNVLHSQNLIPFKKGGLFGYSDLAGRIIIEPAYEKVRFFDEQGYAQVTEEGQVLLIDSTGSPITAFRGLEQYEGRFDKIGRGAGKTYRFEVADQAGVLDSNLQVIFQTAAKSVAPTIHPEYFTIRKRENGQSLTALSNDKHRLLTPFKPGRVGITWPKREGDRLWFYTRNNNNEFEVYLPNGERLPKQYNAINSRTFHHSSFVICSQGDSVDLYDHELNLIYENFDLGGYRKPSSFSKSYPDSLTKYLRCELYRLNDKVSAYISPIDGQCFCIDRNTPKNIGPLAYADGKLLIEDGEKFKADLFNQGAIIFEKEGKKGIKNLNQQIIIPPGDYLPLNSNKTTYITVKDKNRFIHYDKNGQAIPGKSFHRSTHYLLQQEANGLYAFHKGDGKPLNGYVYDTLFILHYNHTYLAKKNNQYEILDTTGTIVKTLPYDQIVKLRSNKKYYIISKGNKKGLLNYLGEIKLEPTYQDLTNFTKNTNQHLFIATDFQGNKQVITVTGQVIYPNLKEPQKYKVKTLKDGYYLISYDRGPLECFSPSGQKIMSLENKGSFVYSQKYLKRGLIKKDGYLINFKTGIVYKE